MTRWLLFAPLLSLAIACGVSPPSAPDPPIIVTVEPGNAEVIVVWSAPDSDGGERLTGYRVTSTPGDGYAEVPGYASRATVEGLVNGVSYRFSVVATSSAGTSLPSKLSEPVTPATQPDAPVIRRIVAGSAEATIQWSPPDFDGGSPIIGYVVTVFLKDFSGTPWDEFATRTERTEASVTGLTDGAGYIFSVRAENGVETTDYGRSEPTVFGALPPNDLVPIGAPARVGNWDVTVLEVLHGVTPPAAFRPAWNSSGERVTTVRIRATRVTRPDDSLLLGDLFPSFWVTGRSGAVYPDPLKWFSFDSECELSPMYGEDTSFPPGFTVEGRLCFAVPESGGTPVSMFDEHFFSTSILRDERQPRVWWALSR